MTKLIGGCLCGKIRYEGESDVLLTVLCSCKNCQRASGAASTVNLVIPEDAITLEGELTVYEDIGDSGKTVNRFFCNTCGSAIYSKAEASSGVTILKAGTLDDTSWVKPTMQIYCDSAQSWEEVSDELQKFPKMMPG